MKKNSLIIAIFSILFIVVLIITIILGLKFSKKAQTNLVSDQQINEQPTSSVTPVNDESQDDPAQTDNFKLEIVQVKGNDYIDLYLTNTKNISAIEAGIILPVGVKALELTDQKLFDDIFDNYIEEKRELKIGALSKQVISPKERVKFVRINFDKPIEEDLTINYQIILDQNGNEI